MHMDDYNFDADDDNSHPDEKRHRLDYISRMGIMMGLPTTWCILSICHIIWVRIALRRVAYKRVFDRFGIDQIYAGLIGSEIK